MSKLSDNEDFARSVNFKSIMRVGTTMIDVKSSIGWSYERDDESKDGYLRVVFVYPSGTTISARLRDRKDFYQFLFEIELFIDNPNYVMPDMKKFVKEIEKDCMLSDDGDSKVFFATPEPHSLERDDEDDD